jgi:hypothetical protein
MKDDIQNCENITLNMDLELHETGATEEGEAAG